MIIGLTCLNSYHKTLTVVSLGDSDEPDHLIPGQALPAESTGHHDFIELLQAKLAASPERVSHLKTLTISDHHIINVQQFGKKSIATRDSFGNINIF